MNEPKKPACDPSLYLNWRCCDDHKALDQESDELAVRADSLNEQLDLGGIPRFNRLIDFNWPSNTPHVCSPYWMARLANKSGVKLPDELIVRYDRWFGSWNVTWLKEKVRKFFDDYMWFHIKLQVKKLRQPDCDENLFVDWECCEMHKSLSHELHELFRVADELNAEYHLEGVTHAEFEALRAKQPKHMALDADDSKTCVGEKRWIQELAFISGVKLPAHKPNWWDSQ